MASIESKSDPDSGFLPFHQSDLRFRNFALLSELNSLILDHCTLEQLLDFTQNQILINLQSKDLYIMRENHIGGWKITARANTADVQVREKDFSLPHGHSAFSALQSGSIGLSRTNGEDLALMKLSFSKSPDTYNIITIPLIDGLTPKSFLISVVLQSDSYEPTDVELLTTLQVLLSGAAYRRHADSHVVETSSL